MTVVAAVPVLAVTPHRPGATRDPSATRLNPPATRTDPPAVRLDPPAPGELHLWRVAVRPRPDWLGLLDAAERRRARDCRLDPVRDTFVTSRGAQRLVGAGYLGGEPPEVTVRRDCAYCGADHGRPRFPGGGIDYSVSHTRDWVLVAVTGHGRIGVDVERSDPNHDIDRMAAAALTATERERYGTLPPERRPAWFLSAWTRKEAAMKLTGLGLAAWPDRIDVSGPLASVERVPRWPDAPVHLYELPAPAGHLAALASTVPITRARSITLP